MTKTIESQVEINRAVFEWLVRTARSFAIRNDFESALRWARLAAGSASPLTGHFMGYVASRQLEILLMDIARSIHGVASNCAQNRPPKRWLHVLTHAYESYGHTNLCRRWIESDSEGREHSVVLTGQIGDVPENLRRAVELTGSGTLTVMDGDEIGAVEQARALRKLAQDQADIVVLHIHPDDVVAPLAFGLDGGPPVVFVNHSDCFFWLGVGVADLVVNTRPSADTFTRNYRGTHKSRVLPIPLGHPDELIATTDENRASQTEVRRRLGIPEDAAVVLTIGSRYKFTSIPGYDFLEAAEAILSRAKNAYLIVVGPENEGRWEEVRGRYEGRFLPVGVQRDLSPIFRASDIYVEGIPVSSYTATLEAGLAGLPIVRAPAQTPFPIASDFKALAHLRQPQSVSDYIGLVFAYIKDPDGRSKDGALLHEKVKAEHCGENWRRNLRHLENEIPERHEILRSLAPLPVPLPMRDFMLTFKACRSGCEDDFLESLAKEEDINVLIREMDHYAWAALKNSRCPRQKIAEYYLKAEGFARESHRRRQTIAFGVKALRHDPSLIKSPSLLLGMLESFIGRRAFGILRSAVRKLRFWKPGRDNFSR